MYLKVWPHGSFGQFSEQADSLDLNSEGLGRVKDGELMVFRFHEGQFQRMNVFSEARTDSKGRHCGWSFRSEWVNVRMEDLG